VLVCLLITSSVERVFSLTGFGIPSHQVQTLNPWKPEPAQNKHGGSSSPSLSGCGMTGSSLCRGIDVSSVSDSLDDELDDEVSETAASTTAASAPSEASTTAASVPSEASTVAASAVAPNICLQN